MQIWMTPLMVCALIASPGESCIRTVQDTAVQKITIKYSGFLKDEEFTIRFRKDSYDIVEVLSGSGTVPPDSFYLYEPLLHDYLHFRGLENVVPRIEKLKREIARHRIVDSTRLRQAVRLERELDSLDVRFSIRADSLARRIATDIRIDRTKMDTLRKRIEIERDRMSDRISRELRREVEDLREELEYKLIRERGRLKEMKKGMNDFLDALIQEGLIPGKEGVKIENRKGIVWINGRKLTAEETEKVKTLWDKHLDHPFDASDKTVIQL